MRAFLLVFFSLWASAPLGAQQACSTAAVQRDAAAVAHIRFQLRSIKLNEDAPDDGLPAVAQEKVPALKSALVQTTRDVLACNPPSVEPSALQTQIAKLLHANPPQPPPDASVMNGDKRYTEWLTFNYGGNLLVTVGDLSPELLTVTFTFHIPCGDDNLLMIFEPKLGRWRERLLSQAPPYKEISGAFGDIYENVLLPATPRSPWRLVTVHGRPWCISRFNGFAIDVLEPTSDPDHPRIIWHTERGYSRGDGPATLKASGSIFEFRINADAMQFDSGSAFERRVIYRYRVTGNRVERIEPIALNARGFVEEWLSMSWHEAAAQTTDSASTALRTLHQNFEQQQAGTGNTFIQPSYGPVLACKPSREYQVEMKAERDTIVPGKAGGDSTPLPSTYYRVRDTGNGYQLLSASSNADPQCSGSNLMRDGK